MLSDIRGEGSASVLDVQSLIFLIKEDWICAMARRHADKILLARYLPLTLTSTVNPSLNDTIAFLLD